MSEPFKKIRFYVVLPLLILPFITILFGLAGGGKASADTARKRNGLNTMLPHAINVKDSSRDKLGFYEQAVADSIKRQEQISRDPYALSTQTIEQEREVVQTTVKKNPKITYQPSVGMKKSPAAELIAPTTEQLNNLHESDPDIEAIHQVLDKLATIQQPAQVASNQATTAENIIGVFDGSSIDESFFGRKQIVKSTKRFLTEDSTLENRQSFSACIPNSQILEAGSMVKLQLNQAISVGGQQLPAGTFIYGIASLNNERLMVRVPSVRIDDNIFKVALAVYDLDGIEGIYVPGSMERDVIKSAAEESLGTINVLSLDPSIKTQAAIAGIGAAKNLLRKKVKAVCVRIAAGYKVLLKENK